MLNQSFRQVFVSNTPALLAAGATVEHIAVGQIGILDAKTYRAVTAPTYANNKALKIVHGTPDLSHLPKTYGAANQNEYSKLIKGKLLKNFRGKAAHKGQQEVWVLGNSGDAADTNSLTAKPGQKKQVAVTLTGGFIDKLYSSQGLTRKFEVEAGSLDDCGDPCVDVPCNQIQADLLKQMTDDKELKKFLRISSIVNCNPALPAGATNVDYIFVLTLADTQDQAALAAVQSQYPNDSVERTSTNGIQSTYRIIRDANTTPTAASTSLSLVIPDCDVCPTGYTLRDVGFAYKVIATDAGNAGAQTAVATAYGIDATEQVSRVAYEFGQSTYVVASDTALTQQAGSTLSFLGELRNSCVLTTPTTVAWTADGTLTKFSKGYTIVVADDICGDDRLADIQAAFPNLVVSIATASTGECVHTYETSVFSQPLDVAGCSIDQAVFEAPHPFEGIQWVANANAAIPAGTQCLCGIRFDVAVVNRTTNECTFDSFPVDFDTVHLQISEFNEEYSTVDSNPWVARKIQGYQRPIGTGAYIQREELDSLMYDLRFRSFDPVVRGIENFELQAKADRFYDEYVLEFDFEYKVGGWSEKYEDSYHLFVYFPQGTGVAFENAINSYVSSNNIAIDPVKIAI